MKQSIFRIVIGAALAVTPALTAAAQTNPNKTTNKKENMTQNFKLPPLKLEQYKLENGLRVVLNQDNAVPVVSVAVYYDVG